MCTKYVDSGYLLRSPTAAVDSFGADILHVKAVHHLGAVLFDGQVHLALRATAAPTKISAHQVCADHRSHCNRNDGGQLLCKCTNTRSSFRLLL